MKFSIASWRTKRKALITETPAALANWVGFRYRALGADKKFTGIHSASRIFSIH